MLFIMNVEGTVMRATNEPLYQGSSDVNKIVLLAPYTTGTVITVHFQLPNGQYVYPYFAAPVGEQDPYAMTELDLGDFPGFYDEDGKRYNVWSLTVDYPLTQYAGVLTIQFNATTSTGYQTSSIPMVTVARGLPYLPPAIENEAYGTIISAMQAAQAAQENAENAQADAEADANDSNIAARNAESSANAAAQSATDAAQSAEEAQAAAENAAESAAIADEKVRNVLTRINPDEYPTGDPSNPDSTYVLGRYAGTYVEYLGADGVWRLRLLRTNNAAFASRAIDDYGQELVNPDTSISNLKSSRIPLTDSAGRLTVVAPNNQIYYSDTQTAATLNQKNAAIPLWYADERYMPANYSPTLYLHDFEIVIPSETELVDATSNSSRFVNTWTLRATIPLPTNISYNKAQMLTTSSLSTDSTDLGVEYISVPKLNLLSWSGRATLKTTLSSSASAYLITSAYLQSSTLYVTVHKSGSDEYFQFGISTSDFDIKDYTRNLYNGI